VGDGPGYLSEEQIIALISYIKTLGMAPQAAPAPSSTATPRPTAHIGGGTAALHTTGTSGQVATSPARHGAGLNAVAVVGGH
jgi:hypothetical protein